MPSTSDHILILGLHYSPEPSGNAPYTHGLARGLAARDLKVQVVTGYPHYPQWKRYAGYSGWRMEEEIDGVAVKRLRHYVPRKPHAVARLWMEVSFGLRLIAQPWKAPSSVVMVSPALFSTGLAVLKARFSRRRPALTVWVQDLYSLGMLETGMSSSSGAKFMRAIESRILRSADGVVVIHDRFKSHLINHLNVDPDRVEVIRNWTHLRPVSISDREATRLSFGWKNDDVIVLHAGNMGVKQGLENVIRAAELADASGSKVRFVLVGDGNQRAKLQNMAEGVERAVFLDSLPADRFQQALSSADILLVNDLPGLKEMSVPSKLTSYFASGVPVLAATDASSVTAEEIRNASAGVCVAAGEPRVLLAAAESLSADSDAAKQLVANAEKFMHTTLSENQAISQYHRYLNQIEVDRRS